MPPLSNAEAALLGLLSEKPMYPYQIEQEVQYRDMRFWTELSMSSIYKVLRKLHKEGFATKTNKVSEENRLRTFYTISPKGKRALRQTLKKLLREPEHIRWQIDIGTYNSDLLPDKKILDCLTAYRENLLKKIEGYKELLHFLKKSGCPDHRFHVASRPMYLLKGEIAWVDSALLDVKKKKGVTHEQ